MTEQKTFLRARVFFPLARRCSLKRTLPIRDMCVGFRSVSRSDSGFGEEISRPGLPMAKRAKAMIEKSIAGVATVAVCVHGKSLNRASIMIIADVISKVCCHGHFLWVLSIAYGPAQAKQLMRAISLNNVGHSNHVNHACRMPQQKRAHSNKLCEWGA